MIQFKKFKWADEQFEDYLTIEGSPRFYVTPDGNFPSMTSLLKVFDDGGIEKWRKRVGEEEANRITNEAVARGNDLHDYNELYLQNRLVRSEMKGQARTLFNRVKRHLDKIDLVLGTEIALYNKDDEYAGRTDAIGMIEQNLCIIDHKNSRKPIDLNTSWGRKKLFKYQIQCTGYGRALYKMKGYRATKGFISVGNHNTSTSDVFFFDLEPFEKELDIAIHAYHNNGSGIENSMYFKL